MTAAKEVRDLYKLRSFQTYSIASVKTLAEKRALEYRQARVKESWDMVEHNDPDLSTYDLITIVATATGEDIFDVVPLYLGAQPT
jgi:hypothetical protein